MDIQCALNAQLDIWWQASSWERGLRLDAEDSMKKEREAGEHSAIMNFYKAFAQHGRVLSRSAGSSVRRQAGSGIVPNGGDVFPPILFGFAISTPVLSRRPF